jgi:replicative superfamily II helicase
VVISYSGHGSDTHELITYDADRDDLASTCLSLDELTELVSAIPARQLVVILDCCFSGGAGAKVLRASRVPRGAGGGVPLSTQALLERLAGQGRLILTASTGDQPAWENPRYGHGLLTYHLLQALQGGGDVVRDGKVSLYELLGYVTRSVIGDASGNYGARQHPTLRGRMDGQIQWPVFTPGSASTALFPSLGTALATRDITGLSSHGVGPAVLEAWSAAFNELNDLQVAAINEAGVLRGDNVLVTAPTSSGKTMIGELAAVRAAEQGGRSVFLLPTRALVNEQYERFRRIYGPLGLRVVHATGESGDHVGAILRGQFDLAVLTYEKFGGLAIGYEHLLSLLGVAVIDEVQTVVDRGRGPYLEFILTLLKMRSSQGVRPQVIALSAVLGDLGGLDTWLGAYHLAWTERPVPLQEGVLVPDGTYRHLTADGWEASEQLLPPIPWATRNRDVVIPLVAKLVDDGQQVIVFRSTRGAARSCAGYLVQALGLPAADVALARLPASDPSGVSTDLRNCLAGGVAFHISDLERDEKRVLEECFREPDSQIRVLVATTTLAQGVNLPAETVVIAELDHPLAAGATTPYTVAEYKNIAGRAGRKGLVQQGRAIVLAGGAFDGGRIWGQYITGQPEALHSRLLGDGVDLYTLLLRVVAVATPPAGRSGLSEDDIVDFLALSFAGHQARLTGQGDAFSRPTVVAALHELRSAGLVSDSTAEVAMTELGALVAQGGITVASAVRVAQVLRQLQPAQIKRATLIAATQLTDEMDGVRVRVNSRGWQKERQTYFGELVRHNAAPRVIGALDTADRTVGPARAKKAVACLHWMGGLPVAQIERNIMIHLPGNDAAGPVRATASRMLDVIPTVIEIARHLHPDAALDELARLLPVQLEHGVPSEVVPLAAQAGASLGRADYLRLHAQGLVEPVRIIDADEDALLECVGGIRGRLEYLRAAAERMADTSDAPDFAALLAPSVD